MLVYLVVDVMYTIPHRKLAQMYHEVMYIDACTFLFNSHICTAFRLVVFFLFLIGGLAILLKGRPHLDGINWKPTQLLSINTHSKRNQNPADSDFIKDDEIMKVYITVMCISMESIRFISDI